MPIYEGVGFRGQTLWGAVCRILGAKPYGVLNPTGGQTLWEAACLILGAKPYGVLNLMGGQTLWGGCLPYF